MITTLVATLAVALTPTTGAHCPRGLHSVADYRGYASVVYLRGSVSKRAHRRLAYMLKCQSGSKAAKLAERYHRRYKRQRVARRRPAVPSILVRIARCESGGDPRAISPGGTYRGKYQFAMSTWASVGGRGDPAAASEAEQDRRAMILLRTGGPGHWPVCSRR